MMKKILLLAVATAALTACSGNKEEPATDAPTENVVDTGQSSVPSTSATENPASDGVSPQPTAAAPTQPVKPRLGPKTTAASFTLGNGGRLQGDEVVQSHFNVINGHLETDKELGNITFTLNSDGVSDAYPKVKILVHTPKSSEWTELESDVVVKGEITKKYEVAAEIGRYAFRINYGATEPEVNTRPVLIVKSVELTK